METAVTNETGWRRVAGQRETEMEDKDADRDGDSERVAAAARLGQVH